MLTDVSLLPSAESVYDRKHPKKEGKEVSYETVWAGGTHQVQSALLHDRKVPTGVLGKVFR